MEILSTGQKIKRARIYKGITLKELCKDSISISKMSCIENEKIKPDEKIIRYIADIIDIDYDYLVQDVYEQIENNLNQYKKQENFNDQIINEINENISYAIEYEYYDLAFELYHLIYKDYIKYLKLDECDAIIQNYYSVFRKVKTRENVIAYYYDMASYLYWREEYLQASVYYNRLIENLFYVDETYKNDYRMSEFNMGVCYYKANEISKAYDVLKKLVESEKDTNELEIKKVIYKYFALSCIKLSSSKQNEYIMRYENIKCKRVKNGPANDKVMFAEAYFYVKNDEKAIRYIKEAIEEFDKDDIKSYVLFLSTCIELLVDNKKYDYAIELAEENLNNAIYVDDIKLIEKAYYLKGRVLQSLGKYEEADRCMNLSLDSLFKFGSKKERYNRHLQMGLMYYKLGQTKDAVKYFNYALKLKKKL